ncbi:VWA domain-containing protein [Geminocystis sp. NIES-3709]|uniref:VWA domain-containing protein n=1 Tax=Geminocystis sp. NIES-3709 TaxID=1617448 RepID=UPI0005FCA769|nr:VWA domain-containing protein [Geminocystis sp. NIES-3709]BAQ66415.1 hypothetical protein GM3709_3180 [Geminocystis sp. NIES-3709]
MLNNLKSALQSKKILMVGTIVLLSLTSGTIAISSNFQTTTSINQNEVKLKSEKTEISNNNLNSNKPRIQIAILLDSSNSMDGLIEQTRTQIWSVINAVSKVTKNGQNPIFEVSLYHYGNDTLPSSEGFNRMLNELTTDLDKVSENLFSIQTNGGQEYAGWVIDSAMNQLKWSDNTQDFRVIFVAGNEPFDQGTLNWQKAMESASKKDVIVNTIYCGDSESSESNLWANAANVGKGSYFNLNQNEKVVTIPTPYDAEIAELNRQLNETYIYYGNEGAISYERQTQQDSNAFGSSESTGINRSIAKVTGNYRNSDWDLVDAIKDKVVDLNTLDKSTLPENLRSLSVSEIKQIVDEMMTKREQIKAKIAELSQKRTEYIAKNTPQDESNKTLDSLMISTLYKQLEAKGFEVK